MRMLTYEDSTVARGLLSILKVILFRIEIVHQTIHLQVLDFNSSVHISSAIKGQSLSEEKVALYFIIRCGQTKTHKVSFFEGHFDQFEIVN